MFRAKFAKMFKNTFLEKHLPTSASLSGLLGWVKVKKITEIVVRARNSHRRCYMKKLFIKYFAIFAGKYLCWSLLIKFINYNLYILIKFIKKRLEHRRFPVNVAQIKSNCFEEHLRTTAFKWESLIFY